MRNFNSSVGLFEIEIRFQVGRARKIEGDDDDDVRWCVSLRL